MNQAHAAQVIKKVRDKIPRRGIPFPKPVDYDAFDAWHRQSEAALTFLTDKSIELEDSDVLIECSDWTKTNHSADAWHGTSHWGKHQAEVTALCPQPVALEKLVHGLSCDTVVADDFLSEDFDAGVINNPKFTKHNNWSANTTRLVALMRSVVHSSKDNKESIVDTCMLKVFELVGLDPVHDIGVRPQPHHTLKWNEQEIISNADFGLYMLYDASGAEQPERAFPVVMEDKHHYKEDHTGEFQLCGEFFVHGQKLWNAFKPNKGLVMYGLRAVGLRVTGYRVWFPYEYCSDVSSGKVPKADPQLLSCGPWDIATVAGRKLMHQFAGYVHHFIVSGEYFQEKGALTLG